MLESIDEILGTGSGFLWGYILLFCLLGTHLYLTVVLRFPQRHLFRAMSYYFKRSGEGHISHFASLMVSLAANVGTGNIIGVAVAVSTGGPGAVFWCMVTGLLGMATRYAECLLAIRYRRVDALGHLVGGPMYVLEHGLHCKWLAVVFAVLTAIAAFGIGNLTQANAVSAVLQESALNIPTWATATVLCILVAAVLLGGLRGIAHTCKACVPTMALVYTVGCVLVLAAHADFILPAVWVAAVFVGAVIPKSSIVWNFSDCVNALMALPNLVSLVALSPLLVAQTRRYLWSNCLDDVDPEIAVAKTAHEGK